MFCKKESEKPVEEVSQSTYENSDSQENIDIKPKPDKIDFQPVIDEWIKTISGDKSILVYDLDRDELAGEYNEKENYNTASLYKLFVVYEGYRRLENNDWQADDLVRGTGHTVLECLDLAIRESYSPCAEVLWEMIDEDKLDRIIETDFGIYDSEISELVSNAKDIAKIMQLFYEHPDIKDENLLARMWDSFLNQPKTSYDWRQGLPSGFSDNAKVYNKVGWDYNNDEEYWNVYHDAAIVEFPEEDRHFVVVVMTSRIPYQQIRKFGAMIEEKFYQ